MGLFRRISDIVCANFNELVDQFEDPEAMLRQAVREMETAVNSAMNRAAKSLAHEKLLARQLDDQRRQAEHWHQRAAEAVHRGDDDQARRAVGRKLESVKLQEALADQLSATEAANRKLRTQIDAMRVRLSEARRSLAVMAARQQSALARKQLAGGLGDLCVDNSAFSRFDRICRDIEFTEAEAEAYIELCGDTNLETPDDIDLEIEAELQAIKGGK
jgi:phage shock protein A